MIKYLYKYMNLRAEFFNEPMLRATPLYALNDPFEGVFNINQVKNANIIFDNYYSNEGIQTNDMDDFQIDGLMGEIQSDLFEVGIISLTKNKINPLMWSHYADEHKGVVIELSKNIPLYEDSLQNIDGMLSRFDIGYEGLVCEYPKKILYQKNKPTFENDYELQPSSITPYPWDKFHKSILFTKSNHWSYEKEYRSSVKLSDADRIICSDCEYIRKICTSDTNIDLMELPDNKIQITYPREYEMHEDMGDESIKQEISLLIPPYDSTVMHFFRINPECINAIYFGYKSNIDESLDNLYENKNFKHIKEIYKMDIDDCSYSLIAKRVEN